MTSPVTKSFEPNSVYRFHGTHEFDPFTVSIKQLNYKLIFSSLSEKKSDTQQMLRHEPLCAGPSKASWMDEHQPDVESRFDPHSEFSRLMTKIKYNAQVVLAELGCTK